MSKNKFAQLLYGKIIYIFETYLTMEELSSIFSPKTYWVDITGTECEVGYVVQFVDGEGLCLVPPPNKERTFEQEKAAMLEKVNAWTERKITGGFISSASGEEVYYDSDKDTQITMQGIALNVNTELFANEYPDGCPVRGYEVIKDEVSTLVQADFSKGITQFKTRNKTVYMLNAEQVLRWCADLSRHIGACKQEGWVKQAEVNACTTMEELAKIVLE